VYIINVDGLYESSLYGGDELTWIIVDDCAALIELG